MWLIKKLDRSGQTGATAARLVSWGAFRSRTRIVMMTAKTESENADSRSGSGSLAVSCASARNLLYTHCEVTEVIDNLSTFSCLSYIWNKRNLHGWQIRALLRSSWGITPRWIF